MEEEVTVLVNGRVGGLMVPCDVEVVDGKIVKLIPNEETRKRVIILDGADVCLHTSEASASA